MSFESVFKKRNFVFIAVFALLATASILLLSAASPDEGVEAETVALSGPAFVRPDNAASSGQFVEFSGSTPTNGDAYAQNLAKIRSQPWRNTNEDDSPYRTWTMQQLDADAANQLTNSRSAYNDGQRGDGLFTEVYNEYTADPNRGGLRAEGEAQFRLGCEFSHFAYDDPIVYPGQPERSHLHMFFGNTDVNAYTTYDKLLNTGGGTCNGNEMNRTGYWAPAVFDQDGNVRIPDFLNLYYKNEKAGIGATAIPFPVAAEDTWVKSSFPGERIANFDGMQLLANIDQLDTGAWPRRFMCIGKFGGDRQVSITDIPSVSPPCSTDEHFEVAVFFPPCWNGASPLSNYNSTNLGYPRYEPNGGVLWYERQLCGNAGYDQSKTFSGIMYRMRYNVEPGDNTQLWYLSSDVDRGTLTRSMSGGRSTHGDWWGAWNPTVKELWNQNCQNIPGTSCGYGFMDARTIEQSPNGPTLRFRERYNPPSGYNRNKIPAQEVYNALCSHAKPLQRAEQAAWCVP